MHGGMKVEYGLDGNNNATLETYEINATLTQYLCNGAQGLVGPQGSQGATGPQGPAGLNGQDGSNGQTSLVKSSVEPAGVNCTTGGVKLEYGLDANKNGVLDAGEVNSAATNYVCNGSVGATGSQGPQGPIGLTGATGHREYKV